MKRLLAIVLALLATTAGTAGAGGIGLGAYGGMSFPLVQEDVSQGSLMGLRIPVTVVPLLTVEPYWASSSLGDKDQTVGDFTYTREGFDESAFGVNAMLTTGGPVQFYPFVGIGRTKLERSGYDASLTTYNAGFGVGFAPVPKLSVHVRGEFQMAVDGEASRKFGNVTLGASYALFSLP